MRSRGTIAAIVTMLLAAACTTIAPDRSARIQEALPYIPADVSGFGFTDWAAIKASVGMADVTSDSDRETHEALFRAITDREGVATDFAAVSMTGDPMVQAEAWSWGVTDLDWEAQVNRVGGTHASAYVLRMRSGFDLAPVNSRYDERGFPEERIGDAVLRAATPELLVTMTDLADFDPAVANAAFLADGRTMVMSSQADEVRAIVELLGQPQTPDVIERATRALADPWVASIIVGDGTCQRFQPGPDISPDLQATTILAAQDQLRSAGTLHAYDALALGYTRRRDPVARIAMVFDGPASADADLAGRRMLADEGISLRENEPYRDSLFVLRDASAENGVIKLDLAPLSSPMRDVIVRAGLRDLLPAACGIV